MLVRDTHGSVWSHLALCSLHEDLFDVVPDGVVVPAPHGITEYQTLFFFPTAFARRRGTPRCSGGRPLRGPRGVAHRRSVGSAVASGHRFVDGLPRRVRLYTWPHQTVLGPRAKRALYWTDAEGRAGEARDAAEASRGSARFFLNGGDSSGPRRASAAASDRRGDRRRRSSGSSTTTAFWRRSGRRAVDAGAGARRRRSGVPSRATLSLFASRGVMSWPVGVVCGDALAIGDALAMLRPWLEPVWAAFQSG